MVSAGDLHTCALLGDGTPRCWGDNTYGQLGNGTMSDALTPVAPVGF
jgi:alpha-tubulin suppressor-like RCC1 family protein